MRRQLMAIAAMTVVATAHAECFVRSAMTAQTSVKITAVADVQPLVVPISDTPNKCIVNFRAQVNGQWISAEGENVGAKRFGSWPDLNLRGRWPRRGRHPRTLNPHLLRQHP